MSQFTATPKLDASTNPRDWAYELACLPTTASIVFTKESFLAFLKTHNIDVSPNYTEINKLPRYAKIGTMSDAVAAPAATPAVSAPASDVNQLAEQVASVSTSQPRAAPAPPQPAQTAAVKQEAPVAPAVAAAPATTLPAPTETAPTRVITPDGHEFRPTRRVREPIGGGSALISALFGSADGGQEGGSQDDFNAEAVRESQRRRGLLQERTQQQEQPNHTSTTPVIAVKSAAPQINSDEPAATATENHFRPTRRVREPGGTGGSSSIALG